MDQTALIARYVDDHYGKLRTRANRARRVDSSSSKPNSTAAMETDPAIEAFRQTLDRLDSITSQLRTLDITILRADELPGLIGGCRYPSESQWLKEEQAAIGQPVALRVRRSQLATELRQVNSVIGEHLRAAIEAATKLVTDAAGGQLAAGSHAFARWHLEELVRNHSAPPVPITQASRLNHHRTAVRGIDASLAALQEIRFKIRRSREGR